MNETIVNRCAWALGSPELERYHDEEWGRRPQDDASWFEALTLEVFQSGLSWRTVLQKREAFRQAFQDYDLSRVAKLTDEHANEFLQNPKVIRHRKKFEATVHNAQVLAGEDLGAFFDKLFVEGMESAIPQFRTLFKFVGKTTVTSFAEATGYIPAPHDKRCFLGK